MSDDLNLSRVRRGPGRPRRRIPFSALRTPKLEPRDEKIQVWVRPEEKKAWQGAAVAADRSLSDWLRGVANAAQKPVRDEINGVRFGNRLRFFLERHGGNLQGELRTELLRIAIAVDADADLLSSSKEAVLAMAVARLGGLVEGAPTHRGNFLQRIDALVRVERDTAWRPIATAPKDGTYILLGWFLEHGGGGHPEVGYWTSEGKWYGGGRGLRTEGYFSPTHWMPLTDPRTGI